MDTNTRTNAELYAKAYKQTFYEYETVVDKKGRSQQWKISAIKEDFVFGRKTTLTDDFFNRIEEIIVQLEMENNCVPQVDSVKTTRLPLDKSKIEIKNTIPTIPKN